jgi:hypothetical protein
MSLAKELGLLLGVHARLHLAAAVQLAVASVIVEVCSFGDVVGMFVVDKVANLLVFFLLVFGLILVIDDGFNIEKGISSISATFSTVALRNLN